jgi:hypothetical protein
MQSDTCSEVLDAVRHFLDYLFDDFGFVVSAVIPGSGGGRCLIVLSSERCRFRVIFNRGDLEVAVGTLSAPVSWEDKIAGVTQWYYLRGALDYVKNAEHPNLNDLRRPVPFLTLEQKLAEVAADLKSDCWKVIKLFQKDNFDTRQCELDRYLQEGAEQLQRQLAEWQREQRRRYGGPSA